MSKLIFKPVSIVAGLLSGMIGKKLFDLIWRVLDKEQPPRAEQRRISVPKLALALLIEGAVFRAVKGLVDHGSREGFARVTGSWPGEDETAEPAEPESK
jgi:xanthosine utilization system XapX-like protein